jgi:serine/threonine protein kinase
VAVKAAKSYASYAFFDADKELYMIMEYCNGGELFDEIVAKGK